MERNKDNVSYLQTAGRALEVLMMFQNENTLTLKEIAAKMGVSTTVAYRLVYTLTVEGFLYQDTTSKQYSLGDKVMMLGFCSVQKQEVKRLAADLLWNFYEKTHYSAFLTIPCANQSLCIHRVLSTDTGRRTLMSEGGLYPLHSGASNRVLLAFCDKEKRESYINSLDWTEKQKNDLREDLAKTRKRGYDFTKKDMTGGLFAVAFPIYNSSNELVAGLSTGGIADTISDEDLETCIQETRFLSISINERMGASIDSL